MDQASLSLVEREVVRLAIRKGEAISPKAVEKYLIPASGINRVHSYHLGDQVKHPIR